MADLIRMAKQKCPGTKIGEHSARASNPPPETLGADFGTHAQQSAATLKAAWSSTAPWPQPATMSRSQ